MTRFPIDGTGRLSSEREHPTTVLTGPAGGDLAGSYPNPTVLGSVTVSGLVAGNTDNTATVQAAVDALDQTYGGTLQFPQGDWYVPGPVTLPRLAGTGQIHIDLGGSTVWTDQGNPIFQCLVSRSLGHDPTDLLAGCVDWEIRNGVLFSSNHLAGSRGIQIEASYNLRFRGLHFWQFEIGEEVRFGLMHSDEDCRYTNNTLCDAYHGSGEAVGHVSATTSLAGATITVPGTIGFDSSGTVTVYNTGSGNRSGATSTFTFTGKTATTFTGCTLTAGSNSAAAGSLYRQTLWAGASLSDGCHASTHKGRHYCGSGMHTALAVHCTDGHVLQAGSIFEGSNPVYNIDYDGGGLTTVNGFEQSGSVHLESNPTGAIYRFNCQGVVTLNGLSSESTTSVYINADLGCITPRIIIRDPQLFDNTTGIFNTGAPGNGMDWLIIGGNHGIDFTASTIWVGGNLPSNLMILNSQSLNIANVKAQSITNGRTGNTAINLGNSDALGFFGVTAVVQASRVGQLTNSTGGSVSTTLAAGITDSVAKDAIASLATKVNALETIIHNLGFSA